MKVGIIGLPNVGKTSLFNLLTRANAQVAKFPFTTIERNVGVVIIPDERLDRIVEIIKSPKKTYAHVDFVDIAGLIKGASKGEGLGNKFLSHIRDVNLVLHVLRCFPDPDIPHTDTDFNPEKDYEVVRSELFLADLEIVERRLEKIKKKFESREEFEILTRIKSSLEKGIRPQEKINDLPLLTTIPEIVVLNLDEDGKFKTTFPGYRISVKLEEDIKDFSEEEKMEFRKEAGLETGGLSGLLKLCLQELSIITFFTIKGEESRAWIIKSGTTVIEAAGKIHSDLKEGFIKAEILKYEDLLKTLSFTRAQEQGLTRIEGKEYIVQDGDIILIKSSA
ncbi:MAG: redox-regulated ATPase YchF [candidate division WOR-3 bacterium]|nr:redox-regulated ATPase YchF [candidate division WOR-3 bacterium]